MLTVALGGEGAGEVDSVDFGVVDGEHAFFELELEGALGLYFYFDQGVSGWVTKGVRMSSVRQNCWFVRI